MRQRTDIEAAAVPTFHPLHLAVDHDDVVVVPVGAGGGEDDDEDGEDEVLMCDHGAVTPRSEAGDSCHMSRGHEAIVCSEGVVT